MLKSNKLGVFEIANRVAINNTTDAVVEGLAGHQSETNTSAHEVSNISGLQAALNEKEYMFSKNTAFNRNFGTTSGTVCQGNDSRLSDARTPTAHAHTVSDVSGLETALGGKQDIINGYTGNISVVVGVDFMAQTVTSKTVNVSNGIITSIA